MAKSEKISALRAKIFATPDLVTEKVHIDVWDVDINCTTMNARERANWIDTATDKTGKLRAAAMYDIVLSNSFDPETGELVFDLTDRDELLKKSGAAVGKLQEVIFRLSGLSAEAETEAAKN